MSAGQVDLPQAGGYPVAENVPPSKKTVPPGTMVGAKALKLLASDHSTS